MGTKHGLTVEERFWLYVDKRDPDECWNWVGATDSKGYGKLLGEGGAAGKFLVASRYSYELHNGPIPKGMYVCHTCDNRRCVNPLHLFQGTAKENTQDMMHKGRANSPYGERISTHKLTTEKVMQLRQLINSGAKTISEIAYDWGVGYSVIWYAATKRTWRHI